MSIPVPVPRPPVRPRCAWFVGCGRPAAAIVSRGGSMAPAPACSQCIDTWKLRDRVVAALLEPPEGDGPLVEVPVTPRAQHAAEHFFKGVCICPCGACTHRVGTDRTRCVCPDCPGTKCGAKELMGV